MSYLNAEVIRTEPSPSVSIPWSKVFVAKRRSKGKHRNFMKTHSIKRLEKFNFFTIFNRTNRGFLGAITFARMTLSWITLGRTALM